MTNSIADEEIVAIKKDIIIYAHCNISQVVKSFSNVVKNFLDDEDRGYFPDIKEENSVAYILKNFTTMTVVTAVNCMQSLLGDPKVAENNPHAYFSNVIEELTAQYEEDFRPTTDQFVKVDYTSLSSALKMADVTAFNLFQLDFRLIKKDELDEADIRLREHISIINSRLLPLIGTLHCIYNTFQVILKVEGIVSVSGVATAPVNGSIN